MKSCVLAPCAALVIVSAATLSAQTAARALSIDDAVKEALQKNRTLLAQRANLAIADAAVVTASLRPNPVLTADADSLDLLGTGFDATNNAGPPQLAVRVDVPIERAHKRELRTSLAGVGKQLAEAQFADASRRLALDVTVACVDVLEAKAKLQLAVENLQTLQQLVDLNERRLASGAIAPLEVSRSRVAMLQYRGNVRTAELALAEARLKLMPLLGRAPGEPPVDVDDQLRSSPAGTAPNLAELLATARTRRPDLVAGRADRARTQADFRLQLAQGKVDYTLGAEYRRQQGIAGRGNMAGFFVSVPLPIFNRNQGEIARAEAEQAKAGQTLSALEADVAAEVTSAFAEFESARGLLIDIERDLLQPARDARAGTTYTYQAGATSLVDVLDAQRAFNDTMDSYYTAQAAYRRAQARLALVSGGEGLR